MSQHPAPGPTFTARPTDAEPPVPTRPTWDVTLLSAITAVIVVAQLSLAAATVYDTVGSTSALAGLGYLIAAMVATPAVLATLIGVPGFLLRRRAPVLARVLAWTAIAIEFLAMFVLASMWGVFAS